MKLNVIKSNDLVSVCLIDLALLAAICLVPTLSHVLSIPLYKLNPMWLCLLVSMWLVRDKRSSYVMAILLPLVSMLVSGMPTPDKMVCMMAEMFSLVLIYNQMSERVHVMVSMLTAMVGAKLVYYGMKYLIVGTAVLIGTNVWLQLVVMVVYACLFWIATSRRRR